MAPSKQEWYAWTSLTSGLALLTWYTIAVLGLEVGESFISLLIKVLVISVAIEIALGITGKTPAGRVEKDERDRQIEGYGFRNGYYFVMVALPVLAWKLGVKVLLVGLKFGELDAHAPGTVLHYLVATFLLAGIVNAGTRVVLYRRAA
jgi:ABC-type uncharacterized transport system permease subunit